MKANIASGDADPTDGTLGTFNALFPRNNYFNDANLFTPANFFDVHPSLQVSPIETLTLTAAADFFFRYSTNDAVYSPGRIGIPAEASDERFVGTALTLQADWTITPNLHWTLTYTRFFRGPVVIDANGTNVDFLGTWLTFRF
ncbi:alginate export family protein [Leptolyngbya sp. 7M]|nr:alginate export family protein [Leptolyngbya sp. 7M]